MIRLISLPMFMTFSISAVLYFFILILHFKKDVVTRKSLKIFLFLLTANTIYLLAFGLFLNSGNNFDFLNIINRILIISSIFIFIFFFHFLTIFFSLRLKIIVAIFYGVGLLFSILACINTPLFLQKEFLSTSIYYTGLQFGILFKLWAVFAICILLSSGIALFLGYRKNITNNKSKPIFFYFLVLSTATWIIAGITDSLTAIQIVDFPPLSWLGSLLLIANVLILIFETIDNLNFKINTLYDQLIHDHLTGCYSKSYFEIELSRILHGLERVNTINCLVFFDIDNFKIINDTHGHLCGDYILKEIISITNHILRPEDVLARYGGDEFMILLTNIDTHDEVKYVVERIRKNIEQHHFTYHHKNINCTCSFGAVHFDDSIIELHVNNDHLFALSDTALYNSKKNGRNQIEVVKL